MLTYIICYSALIVSDSSSCKCKEIFKGKSWLSNGKWNSYFMNLSLSAKNLMIFTSLIIMNWWISLWHQFPCLPAICKNCIPSLPAETMWKGIWFCLASLECWYRTLINVWLISWFKHHSVGQEVVFWSPP